MSIDWSAVPWEAVVAAVGVAVTITLWYVDRRRPPSRVLEPPTSSGLSDLDVRSQDHKPIPGSADSGSTDRSATSTAPTAVSSAPKEDASEPGRRLLGVTDPAWEHHSGRMRHTGPEWQTGDEALAERMYSQLPAKARAFSDLLTDHPGEVFSVDDIVTALPGVFSNDRSIAGSLNGFSLPCENADRRYPFRWWDSHPTEYAIHPGVATVLREGRRRWRGGGRE